MWRMPSKARREKGIRGASLPLAILLLTHLVGAPVPAAAQDTVRPPPPVPPMVDAVAAQVPAAATDSVAVVPGGPADSVELEAWLDGFLEAGMAEDHVAGATVSVVKDGQLFFSKGYGYADEEARIEVDPAVTLFRIGSVSKLFVWTSVMQLVERGMLDLDEDVNTYLNDIEIPDDYDEPVTLSDILTHSAGFEDHVIGLFGDSATDLRPLGEVLAEQLPDRVRPPGEVSSYSNHATGLAMYIVEVVSGTPWEQYIQENILDPLEMEHFTFSQPVPSRLANDASKGYRWTGSGFSEQDFEFVPLAPVGAASASAEDMARFMIAHLQLGEFEGRRILEESTALEMQSVLLRHAPGMNAMLHGFAELSRNGEWIVGHGGDTFWFHTQFAFMPDRNLGIFVSTNSETGNPTAVLNGFIDRYFPAEQEVLTPPDDFEDRAGQFTGAYRANRFSHTDVTKLGALASSISVTSGGDGTLRLSTTGDARWIETEPLTFQQEHETAVIAFRQDDGGDTSHLFFGAAPYLAFERTPLLENPNLHAWMAGIALLMFLCTVVIWPLSGFFRIRFAAEPRQPRLSGLARFIAWGASLCFLLASAGVLMVVSDANQLALGNTGTLGGVLWLPVIGAALGIWTVLYALYAWYDGAGTKAGRVALTLLAFACLTFLWQLSTFNLLGWKL